LSPSEIFLYKFSLKMAKNLCYIVSNNLKIITIVKPALINKLTAVIAKKADFFEKIQLLNSAGATSLRLILISWI